MAEPTVKDYMQTKVITISADAGLDRAMLIMRAKRLRHLPVVDDAGRLLGLISSRDLRMSMRELDSGPSNMPKGYYLPALMKVGAVMSKDVMIATPDMPVARAAAFMSERKIGALPVLDENRKLVGIITETDLLRLLIKMLVRQTE